MVWKPRDHDIDQAAEGPSPDAWPALPGEGLTILELILYDGAQAVAPPTELGRTPETTTHPEPLWHCCGHRFATHTAWLQHQRTQHPVG